MIKHLLEGDYSHLRFTLAIVICMWILVTLAFSIDLIAGYRKAKERGEARTSFGLRRTVQKAVLYYTFMLFAFMLDCIGTFFYPLPVITLIASTFLIFIEGKSVLEKAHDKDRRKINDSLDDLSILLENKDDLIKGLAEVLKQKTQNNENRDNNDKGIQEQQSGQHREEQ